MKKKIRERKLILCKTTIADLAKTKLEAVYGGITYPLFTYTIPVDDCPKPGQEPPTSWACGL